MFLVSSYNGHFDDDYVISFDDENISKSSKQKPKSNFTTTKKSSHSNTITKQLSQSSTTSKKSLSQLITSPTKRPCSVKSPTKAKRQLTLHDVKFTKTSDHNQLLKKSSSISRKTHNVAVPYSLLQKLDKARRDRGVQSKVFRRLVLHCARTLNDKQRSRLPDEYRSLIQAKYEELELKRRLSEMTEQEKKRFLQTKQKQKQSEQKRSEDLDLTSSKILPIPKHIESLVSIPSHYIGDLLVICTFFTSCHSLLLSSLADNLSKISQQFLRSFRHEYLLEAYQTSSTTIFFKYFIEFLQILIKLLYKEDDNRLNNDENNKDDDGKLQQQLNCDQQVIDTLNNDQISIDDDIEQIYDTKLAHIRITPFTCQELTRLYLLRQKNEDYRIIIERLGNSQTNDLLISEQVGC